MRWVLKKCLLLFVFFAGLAVIEACCEVFRFFDYQRLIVWETDNIDDRIPSNQAFWVQPDSVRFFAEGYLPVVTPMAYGTSCPDDGEEGTVFSLDTVLIFSDAPFDAAHPSGLSLNDLFYSYDLFWQDSTVGPISEGISGIDFYDPDHALMFFTPFLPADTSLTHTIEFVFIKSNGTSASGRVSGVRF